MTDTWDVPSDLERLDAIHTEALRADQARSWHLERRFNESEDWQVISLGMQHEQACYLVSRFRLQGIAFYKIAPHKGESA